MPVRTSYLICTTPRSGSNFLCEVLSSTGLAGHPDEYFWNVAGWQERWGVSDAARYLERMLQEGTTPNGVFGIKMMNWHLEECAAMVAAAQGATARSLPDLLSSVFPDLHCIWLTRRDKVRQAVSLHRAHQTKLWRSTDGQARPPAGQPAFDFELIDLYADALILGDAAWQGFFTAARLQPYTLVYEDFIQDPRQAVISLLHDLHVSVPVPVTFQEWQLERQADALSDQWVQHYCQLKEAALAKRLP